MRLVWTQYDKCRVFFLWSATPQNMFGDSNPVWTEQGLFLLGILTEILKIWWKGRNIYRSVIAWQRRTSFYPSRLERGFLSAGIFLDETTHFCLGEHQVVLSPHLLVSNSFFFPPKKKDDSQLIQSREAFFFIPQTLEVTNSLPAGSAWATTTRGFGGAVFWKGKTFGQFENRRTKGSHFLPKNMVHPDGFSGRCVSNEVNVFVACWRCDAVFSRKLCTFWEKPDKNSITLGQLWFENKVIS